jgi:very-short-patch-repair endonuclease
LHGALWVDDNAPIELLWNNNHPPAGIVTRNERFNCDEVVEINDMAVATIQRAAFDMGRHLRRGPAVAHLDALARATGLKREHVAPLIKLYKGARGVRRLQTALDLMDAGAQSPRETSLRLSLIDAGFRRPQTQISVLDENGHPFAFLDMGWEDMMIAVEYDGDQHRRDRAQYAWDVKRLEKLRRLGWYHIRVISEDRTQEVVSRVRYAWAQRETERRAVKRAS